MLTVVAALIVRDGKILVCQRRRDDSHALQWEFPGGKVEPGESHAEGLVRELREELGVDASIGGEIYCTTHRYGETQADLQLIFLLATISETSNLQNNAFERFEWAEISALAQYDFLEADKELIGLIASSKIRLE